MMNVKDQFKGKQRVDTRLVAGIRAAYSDGCDLVVPGPAWGAHRLVTGLNV